MKRTWIIYFLIDPRDGEIRYVGCTRNVRTRILTHLSEARTGKRSRKCDWLRELLAIEMKPEVVEFRKTTSWDRHRGIEETWIRRLGLAGCDLLMGTGRERLIASGTIRPDENRHGKPYLGWGYKRLPSSW